MGLEPTTSTMRRSSALSAGSVEVRLCRSGRCASLLTPCLPANTTRSVANRLPKSHRGELPVAGDGAGGGGVGADGSNWFRQFESERLLLRDTGIKYGH